MQCLMYVRMSRLVEVSMESLRKSLTKPLDDKRPKRDQHRPVDIRLQHRLHYSDGQDSCQKDETARLRWLQHELCRHNYRGRDGRLDRRCRSNNAKMEPEAMINFFFANLSQTHHTLVKSSSWKH